MTECQGCGAWNERHRTLCVLCGTPLAETDEWDAAAELPPLPPLPDGGLSVTMPAWLRAMPGASDPPAPLSTPLRETTDPPIPGLPTPAGLLAVPTEAPTATDTLEPVPEDVAPADQPLGRQADPRTFLRDDDFPRWIRELPALPPRPVVPPRENASVAAPAPLPVAATGQDASLIDISVPTPGLPEIPEQELAPMAADDMPSHAAAAPPALPTAPPETAAHQHEAWETPLLVVLVVGIVVAVLWALLVNGLIGSGR